MLRRQNFLRPRRPDDTSGRLRDVPQNNLSENKKNINSIAVFISNFMMREKMPVAEKIERKDFSDYFICEKDYCDIKPGQEKAVAQNLEAATASLTSGQKTMVLEKLLSENLVAPEKAKKIVAKLDEKNQVDLVKFISKTQQPGTNDDLLFAVLSHLTILDPLRNEESYSYYETFGQLKDFYNTEGVESFADFALFDYGDPTYTLSARIKTDEQAARMADMLANYGDKIESRNNPDIFDFLLNNFPVSLVRRLEKIKQFDSQKRGADNLLAAIFESLPKIAQTRAVKSKSSEIVYTTGPVKPGFSRRMVQLRTPKQQEKKSARQKEEEEELKRLKKEEESKLLGQFAGELDKNQKEKILRYIRDSCGEAGKFLIENAAKFRDCDQKLFVEAAAESFTRYSFEISKDFIKEIKDKGFLRQFVAPILKSDDYAFGRVFARLWPEGLTEEIDQKVAVKMTKRMAGINYWELTENPRLLVKYKTTPPQEAFETLRQKLAAEPEQREGEGFLPEEKAFLENFSSIIQYADWARKAKIPAKYLLDKNSAAEEAKNIINSQPEHFLDHPALDVFKKIFSPSEQANFLKKNIASGKVDLEYLIIYRFEDFKEIILKNPEIALAAKKAVQESPNIYRFGNEWDDIGKFIERTERVGLILKCPQEAAGYPKMLADIVSDTAALEKFIKIIKDDFPSKIPAFLNNSIDAKEAGAETAASELEEWFVKKIQDEPGIVTDFSEVKRWRARYPGAKDAIDPVLRNNFDNYCRTNPEDVWANRSMFLEVFGREEFEKTVSRNKFLLAKDIFNDFSYDNRERFFPDAFERRRPERTDFLSKLGHEILEATPAVLFGTDAYPTMGARVLKIGDPRRFVWEKLQTQAFFPFFSKRLRNILTVSEKTSFDMVDVEFVDLADKCSRLSNSKAGKLFLRLAEGLPRQEAARYLNIADALIRVGQDESLTAELNESAAPEEIKEKILEKISTIFENKFGVSAKNSRSNLIERPAAVLIFSDLHRDNSGITELLRQMVASEVGGKYKEWHYFNSEEEEKGFLNLQSQGLLPKGLTLEQYRAWVRDDKAEGKRETAVEIGGINSANKKVIEDAVRFGHFVPPENVDFSDEEGNSLKLRVLTLPLGEIQARLGEFQKIIAENKKRKKAMAELLPFDEKEYEEAKKLFQDYFAERGKEINLLRACVYLNRLIKISGEEAASGRISVFAERGGEETFDNIFKFLNKVFAEWPEFINDLGRMRKNLAEAVLTGEKIRQTISAGDDVDFITAMEIGVKPLSTCQHYGRNPEFNVSLPAHAADPNTRIFVIRGESGQLIARAVARLLSDGRGNPVLHLDNFYTASQSEDVRNLMLQFAKEKAKKLGIPLAAGNNQQNEWRKEKERVKEKVDLYSFASRNEHVYVDSASSKTDNGVYTIKGAQVVG